MKKMRRWVGLLLAMVMILSMTVSVFAEETYSITINNDKDGHVYEAYQIFVGDLHIETANDGKVTKTLSNVKWGTNATQEGVVTEDILNELKADNADSYVDFTSDPAGTSTRQSNTYVIAGLAPGYYLVKDKDNSLNGMNDAYTEYIIKVVGNVEAQVKSQKPTVDKQVWDEITDAEAGATDGWGETADHSINESFQFKLIATLPQDENFAAYEIYKLVFSDTMSAGITFESIESVTVNGTTITNYKLSDNAVEGASGIQWTLTIDNLKAYNIDLTDGVSVVVVYNAHLNENAKIGDVDENFNKVRLEYSNNPNDDEDLGKTEEDTVWVFTYEMPNKKVDGSNNEALAGAGFRLYTDEACTKEVGLIYDEALKAYRPIQEEEIAEQMYSATTTGEFNVVGLDAGTYYLKETTTPEGYNTCDVVKVVISATHVEDASEATASTTITMTQDGTTTSVNTIVNNKGAILPETGGMGTTVFYVIGAVLVVGAAVVMVTRKRMSGN